MMLRSILKVIPVALIKTLLKSLAKASYKVFLILSVIVSTWYYVYHHGFYANGLITYSYAYGELIELNLYEDALVVNNLCIQPELNKNSIRNLGYEDLHFYIYNLTSYGEQNSEFVRRSYISAEGVRTVDMHCNLVEYRRYSGYYRLTNQIPNTDNAKFEKKVAYIPTFWLTEEKHFFDYIWKTLPAYVGLVAWAKQEGIEVEKAHASSDQSKPALVIPEKISTVAQNIFDSLKVHDIATMTHGQERCFEKAVIGMKRSFTSFEQLSQYYSDKMQMTDLQCPSKLALIIQRTESRRIMNIDDIKDFLQLMRYKVVVISFDDIDFKEQFKLIRCAKVLIGAQGSGLAWYPYLPQHASLVEITWRGWPIRFSPRQRIERPDITSHVLYCDIQTSDETYAALAFEWFHYQGPITASIKRRVESYTFNPFRHIQKSVWRESDCSCPVHLFCVLGEGCTI